MELILKAGTTKSICHSVLDTESLQGTQNFLMNNYYVYILTNRPYGTLYTGVTSNLVKRVYQHRTKATKGFSFKYNVNKLAYFESHNEIQEALKREKQIKSWRRQWKVELILRKNPLWKDLYGEIVS